MGYEPAFEMAEHNILGWKGEEEAVKYLTSIGHRVLERNWRSRGYEIDIITADEEFIVFVEVKTRASTAWGNPEEAIGVQRMRRMIRAASQYLKLNGVDNPARFDVVTVVWNDARFELEHIEDAFMAFLD